MNQIITAPARPPATKLRWPVLLFYLCAGLLALPLAVYFSELEFKYLFGVFGAIAIFSIALMMHDSNKLFDYFLIVFALAIPVRINLGFFYRKEHVGGAIGIDVSAIHVSILIMLALLVYKALKARKRPIFQYEPTLLWPHALFFLAMIWSVSAADDKILSLFEIIRTVVLIAVLFVIMNLKEERHIRILLFLLTFGVFFQAVLAIVQYRTGENLGLRFLGEQAIVGQMLGGMISRATGTIGHPNTLAYFFEILLPLTLALTLVEKKTSLKIWYFIAFAFGMAGIITTLSRAAWLTLPVSLPLVFILALRRRIFRVQTVMIVSVFAIFASIFLYAYYPTIQKRFYYEDYGSARSRIPLNQAALSIIKQFPLTGIGVNNFAQAFKKYDISGGSRILRGYSHVVHNMYLLVAGEMGIIGLLAFLWMFLAVFLVAFRARNRLDEWQSTVLIGISAGLLAQMIHGLFDPGFRMLMSLSTLVYTFIGIAGAVSLMKPADAAGSPKTAATPEPHG